MGKSVVLAAFAFAFAIASLLLHTDRAAAADATEFSIVTLQAGKAPEVRFGGTLRVRFYNGDAPTEPGKIKLILDDAQFALTPAIDGSEATFQLIRNGQTREAWEKILGKVFDTRKALAVGIQVDGKSLKFRAGQVQAFESPQAKIDLLPREPETFAVVRSAEQGRYTAENRSQGIDPDSH